MVVATESRSSDLPDPFNARSLLSMFPRTFKDPPISNHPHDLHNFIKSMELTSPIKLLEMAKGIVEGDSELLNTKFESLTTSDINVEVAAVGMGNPRERRPGLGLKRPRFSMKPDKSQPCVSLEPSLDIDQLSDPEDFFAAHEKLDYANEEIQRQTGGKITGNRDYDSNDNPRRRRPGLSGIKRPTTYKHYYYPSSVCENDDIFISSQDIVQHDKVGPSDFYLEQETAKRNAESQESEIAGSVANTEDKVNELLDELLSTNIENLDGDGALSLLQERLKIKSVDIDKCLPDFSSDIGKGDFMELQEELPKSRKKLTDIQNVMKGLSVKTPIKRKQGNEILVHSLASPTPPKSLRAALSLLKQKSKSNPVIDPFSALEIDLSPARNPSFEHFNGKSDQLDTGKELSIYAKSKFPAVATTSSEKVISRDSPNLFDISTNVNTGLDVDISSCETQGDLVDQNKTNQSYDSARSDTVHILWASQANEKAEKAGAILLQAVSSTQPNINVEDSSRGHTETVAQKLGVNEMDKNVEDMQQDTTSFVQPDVSIDNSTTENLKNSEDRLGQSDSTVAKDYIMGRQQTAVERGSEHKKEQCTVSSLKERTKARKSHAPRGKNLLSRRQSLAAAGTRWESGLRKSTRIRIKPLEYWKGERFLYGRVHESLTTVIGVKRIATAEKHGGEPKFKVTSYVSDEHKELVELAALH